MAVNYPSYNYNYPQSQSYFPSQNQSQSYFPQSQGSAFIINNSGEIGSVPMGYGISIALCLSEGLMYLKTLQNGSPTLMAYRIMPYTQQTQEQEEDDIVLVKNRLEKIEQQLSELVSRGKGGKINEQL